MSQYLGNIPINTYPPPGPHKISPPFSSIFFPRLASFDSPRLDDFEFGLFRYSNLFLFLSTLFQGHEHRYLMIF